MSTDTPAQIARPLLSLETIQANLTVVTLNAGKVVWFSYGTPVAVRVYSDGPVLTDGGAETTTTRRHRGIVEASAEHFSRLEAQVFQDVLHAV